MNQTQINATRKYLITRIETFFYEKDEKDQKELAQDYKKETAPLIKAMEEIHAKIDAFNKNHRNKIEICAYGSSASVRLTGTKSYYTKTEKNSYNSHSLLQSNFDACNKAIAKVDDHILALTLGEVKTTDLDALLASILK